MTLQETSSQCSDSDSGSSDDGSSVAAAAGLEEVGPLAMPQLQVQVSQLQEELRAAVRERDDARAALQVLPPSGPPASLTVSCPLPCPRESSCVTRRRAVFLVASPYMRFRRKVRTSVCGRFSPLWTIAWWTLYTVLTSF